MKKKYFTKIRSIPTLPSVLVKIIATLDDPRSSAEDLEQIIHNDQALTTKLLAVANSAYYGFRHEVTTAKRAVVAIGFNEVRNLCLGMSLMGFLDPRTFRDTVRAEALWLHSLAVAEGSRIVAEWSGGIDSELAFTTGLLHDVGKVVLAAFFPDDVAELKQLMQEKDMDLLEAELALGLSHEEMGKEITQRWELPPIFAETTGNHHLTHRALIYLPSVAAVQAADHIAVRLEMCDPLRTIPVDISKLTYKALGFSEQTMMQCFNDLKERREKVMALWQHMAGNA